MSPVLGQAATAQLAEVLDAAAPVVFSADLSSSLKNCRRCALKLLQALELRL
jgi:hypothetical protein